MNAQEAVVLLKDIREFETDQGSMATYNDLTVSEAQQIIELIQGQEKEVTAARLLAAQILDTVIHCQSERDKLRGRTPSVVCIERKEYLAFLRKLGHDIGKSCASCKFWPEPEDHSECQLCINSFELLGWRTAD